SRMPIQSRLRCMRVSSSLTPTPGALALCQGLARLNQLRPGAVRLGTDGGELLEIPPRPGAVTGAFGRQAGTVQAAETVWFLGDGGFVLRQGFGGAAQLQQHVPKEFTGGHDGAWRHGVLLGLILMIGGGAHSGERLLLLALGEQGPGTGDLGLDLSLL